MLPFHDYLELVCNIHSRVNVAVACKGKNNMSNIVDDDGKRETPFMTKRNAKSVIQ